ncbi:MAG: disulfide bond formation protein B [Alphaproteobacteria bacterium]|nr:disulfide bond formation protein B [Alphaproteobacteria bacterium]
MFISNQYRSWLFFVLGTFVLSAVFIMQYGFDVEPCPLCLWQRVPWEVAIFVALCDRLLWRKLQIIWLVYGLIFIASAGLSLHHIGVERHFWESFLADCKAGLQFDSPEKLLQSLQGVVQNTPCDERVIFMFNFSYADWNFVLSSGLAILSFLPFMMATRKR